MNQISDRNKEYVASDIINMKMYYEIKTNKLGESGTVIYVNCALFETIKFFTSHLF